MAIPRGEPIDLSGLPTQGGGASAPPPGGGGATNMFQQAGVPYYDQWLHSPIYMGMGGVKPGGKGASLVTPSEARGVKLPSQATPFQLLSVFDAFGQTEYQKFKNKLVAAGFVSKDADPVQVRTVFAGVLRDVQSANLAGQSITPFEFINSLIKKNGLDPKKIPGDRDWDPTAELAAAQFQPTTSKVTSVYDLDPADAEDLLTKTLSGVLGRDPSKAEIEDFVDAVKARALADPTTMVSKTRRGDLSGQAGPGTQVEVTSQGDQTFSTVTSLNQGFDENDMARIAERRAKAAPDYASSQAISTYFPAFLSALGATV